MGGFREFEWHFHSSGYNPPEDRGRLDLERDIALSLIKRYGNAGALESVLKRADSAKNQEHQDYWFNIAAIVETENG